MPLCADQIGGLQHSQMLADGLPGHGEPSTQLRMATSLGQCLTKHAGRLADLDQVAIGITNVGADLATMILRLGKELGTLR
jgi:hypothetical protein